MAHSSAAECGRTEHAVCEGLLSGRFVAQYQEEVPVVRTGLPASSVMTWVER